MTKHLYEEALADVKKLREVAEDNAMRAVFEAVHPRLKDIIENELLKEDLADEDELLFGSEEESGEFGGEGGTIVGDPVSPMPPSTDIAVPPAGFTPPIAPVTGLGDGDAAAAAISIGPDGDTVLDLGALKTPEDDVYELSYESAQALGVLLSSVKDEESNFARRVKSVVDETSRLSSASAMIKESTGYTGVVESIISKVEDTYGQLQETLSTSLRKKDYEEALEKCFQTLKKLTEQKMNKTSKSNLNEGELSFTISGLPDDMEDKLEDLSIDIEAPAGEDDTEGGDEDLDLDVDSEESGEEGDELDFGDDEGEDEEIDEGMLRKEIARMKSLRETDETKPQSWGHGAGKVAKGFQEKDEGDPFLDGEVTTESDGEDKEEMDELDELDQAADAIDDGGDEDPQTDKQNRMPESVLRRRIAVETRIQAEARKRALGVRKLQRESVLKARRAAASKKMNEAVAYKQRAQKLHGAYSAQARRFNESVARVNKIKRMIAEATSQTRPSQNGSPTGSAENQNLRTKLAETSLFNAKLLYANKLLQNESLNKRQKAEMIERLDEARNTREVKLVYESLVKTLTSTARKLSESTERTVIGSSSRAQRPASDTTVNEGFEADRWARLAGIVK
jgi:hypothetical protein